MAPTNPSPPPPCIVLLPTTTTPATTTMESSSVVKSLYDVKLAILALLLAGYLVHSYLSYRRLSHIPGPGSQGGPTCGWLAQYGERKVISSSMS
jgi:hypothetical protein